MDKIKYHLNKRWVKVLGGFATVLLIAVVLSYFISSDTLRRYMENRINRNLKEYTVRIEKAYLHPVAFSIDLKNLVLTQDVSPDPPVASIKRIHASVHWRELLSLKLVADFLFEQPKISINLKNIRKEEKSKVPFSKKGWQDALESIYPLKINEFRIRDGELTYQDEGPYKPLKVSDIDLEANNIRNIRARKGYPSPIRMEGVIFDKGKLRIKGDANFLEKPHLGIKTGFDLDDMDLGYFEPVVKRSNLSIRKGTVSAKGNLEYNPRLTRVDMKMINIRAVEIDYIHLSRTARAEQERVDRAIRAAKELSNKPTAQIEIGTLKIENSSLGYINRASNPNYRVFIDNADMDIKNLSNHSEQGTSEFSLNGKFMGTGITKVTCTFRPRKKTPDFTVNVAIRNTDMVPMSDLFRSYGNFDIKEGKFSFFSELDLKEGKINGYVKPLFQGMKVYDRRSREQQGFFHKVYLGLVGGVAKLLENRPRGEVATRTEISGPVGKPETSTWQTVINLLRNAFIKAILPGFEREVSRNKK